MFEGLTGREPERSVDRDAPLKERDAEEIKASFHSFVTAVDTEIQKRMVDYLSTPKKSGTPARMTVEEAEKFAGHYSLISRSNLEHLIKNRRD